jgi:hypothetical protein
VTDEELICAFEDLRLQPGSFHHIDHVRMAFLYLRRFPPLEALGRFSTALGRMAAASGQPGRYHETITWSFVLLIRERIERRAQTTGFAPNWDEFFAENPDLFCRKEPVLRNYYCVETLGSEIARKFFILPDRGLWQPKSAAPV